MLEIDLEIHTYQKDILIIVLIRVLYIKDTILVTSILFHEKLIKFCLIVLLINYRFSKVEGG